jgi:thiamine pyridinylase
MYKKGYKNLLAMFFSFLFLVVSCPVKADDDALTVALYESIPDVGRFKVAVESEWKNQRPDVSLKFEKWDCYTEALRDNVDVFVFDAIFLKDYIQKGYLLPISKENVHNRGYCKICY